MPTPKKASTPPKPLAAGECLFVYGSLKTGYWNNRVLGASICIGAAKSSTKLAMVDGSFPYIVNGGEPHDQAHIIRGELWRIDTARTGMDLDRLEGFPFHYLRKKANFELIDTGELIEAWFYYSASRRPDQDDPGAFIREWTSRRAT